MIGMGGVFLSVFLSFLLIGRKCPRGSFLSFSFSCLVCRWSQVGVFIMFCVFLLSVIICFFLYLCCPSFWLAKTLLFLSVFVSLILSFFLDLTGIIFNINVLFLKYQKQSTYFLSFVIPIPQEIGSLGSSCVWISWVRVDPKRA